MRIVADLERCAGSGVCANALPDVFDQGDDALVLLLVTDVPDHQVDAVADVVRLCPTAALSLVPE